MLDPGCWMLDEWLNASGFVRSVCVCSPHPRPFSSWTRVTEFNE
jgi:hypothetical protein